MEKHGVSPKGKKNSDAVRTISLILLVLAMMLAVSACSDKPTGADTPQPGAASEGPSTENQTVVSYFKNPDNTAKPMVRMWFPDATAGIDDNDTIGKQISALAAAGFGGVEIAMLADSSYYTNDQAAYCGWGSESWVKLLKKVYRAAGAVDGGFTVDQTITAHWPPTINTIDPNDPGASTEMSSSITKITADDLASGTLPLDLPETKTADDKSVHFVFTDTLIASNIARVAEVDGENYTLDFESLQTAASGPVVLDSVSGVKQSAYRLIDGVYYAGAPAGIPDAAYSQEKGWNYEDTLAAWGPEPVNPDMAEKIDADGNKKRLADWQYNYRVDLTGFDLSDLNNSDEIAPGDWVVVATFYRGTGQMYSGRSTVPVMHNRPYVMNYFDTTGIDAVTDYWRDHILDDELVAMMKENGGSIFEDSIEASNSSAFWTYDLLDELDAAYAATGGYEYRDILAAVMASSGGGDDFGGMSMLGGMPPQGGMPGGTGGVGGEGRGGGMPAQGGMPGGSPGGTGGEGRAGGMPAGGMPGFGFGAGEPSASFSFTNTELVSKIKQDHNALLADLYNRQHCIPANDFAAALGCTYRAQAHGLTGVDIAYAATVVDIPEGDNGTKGDGARLFAGAVNMADKKYLSMEAVTGSPIYRFNWEDVLIEAASNFSYGFNRLILHGSAYSKSINGHNADWPGWDQFGGAFGEPYTYRQTYWDRMGTVANYIARNQAVLQYGKAKVDLAILLDGTSVFRSASGNAFQELINNGYSYNQLSDALLSNDNAGVTNGRLYEDGPGYKALILSGVETISVAAMNKIQEYAEAGLPIIFYNSNPSKVYGVDKVNNNQAAVRDIYQRLLNQNSDMVRTAATQEEILSLLSDFGIRRHAVYQVPLLETTLYQDEQDGTRYYYLFNNTTSFQGMITAGGSKTYKEKGDIKNATITLAGSGVPYFLDAVTGDISQAGEYTTNADGTLTLCLEELAAGASTIIAVTTSTGAFPEPAAYVTSVDVDADAYAIERDADGNPELRSNTAGAYTVTLSDGGSETLTVDKTHPTLNLGDGQWRLVIDSYGPTYKNASGMVDERGIQTVDPSDTTVTRVDFGVQKLGNWADIAATPEQLATLGVESMGAVSGRGYYTTSFDMESGVGGYLSFAYGNDQVTAVTINGTEISAVDNISDKLDIGDYLKEGRNEITIELTTTLNKRARVESAVFSSSSGRGFGGGGMGGGSSVVDDYGLTGVTLIPYSQTGL